MRDDHHSYRNPDEGTLTHTPTLAQRKRHERQFPFLFSEIFYGHLKSNSGGLAASLSKNIEDNKNCYLSFFVIRSCLSEHITSPFALRDLQSACGCLQQQHLALARRDTQSQYRLEQVRYMDATYKH